MEQIKILEKKYYKDGAFCIIEKNQKFLFQKRKDNGKWDLPGGGIETDEDPREAMAREVFEETGINLKEENEEIKNIPQIAKLIQSLPEKAKEALKQNTGTVYLYYKELLKDVSLHLNEEVTEFKWFTKEEITQKSNQFTLGSQAIFKSFLETNNRNTCSIDTVKSYIPEN